VNLELTSPPWKPDIYVLSRILERLWKENGPMLKTRLQLSTNTSYDSMMRYVDWMTVKGLVSIHQNDGHDMVLLTPKGWEAYRTLVIWVNETVLE
jgi:predicted transcriptional regulator